MLLMLSAALAADKTLDVSLGLAYWRLGVSGQVKPGLVIDMPWQKEGDLLLGSAALEPQLDISASPAFARVGGRLRFEPMAMLDITPYVYGTQYFGNFQTVVGYDSWDALYGDNDTIAAYVEEEPTRQSTGRGVHVGTNATLKAKAGPAILMVNGDLSRWWVDGSVADDHAYFFEREWEVMMRLGPEGGDSLFMLNGALLYELDRDTSDDKFMRVGSLTT